LFVAIIALVLGVASPALAVSSGGSGGARTDQTNRYFSAGGVTSRYHLYAAGLDWSKPVGLLVYADGSGEYGLAHPTSSYLLGGSNGLVAVAKRHNMVLLTPRAPGAACSAGGVCWHETSSGISAAAKTRWSYDLVRSVKGQYNIDLARVAVGGYSSGAQWAMQRFAPAYASSVMVDGVFVGISFGGQPISTPTFTAGHKLNVPYVWDTGDRDGAYTTTASYGVRAGRRWYQSNGFTTELHVVSGTGHARAGEFGSIVSREITQHVRPAG
jgi:predicted esterase